MRGFVCDFSAKRGKLLSFRKIPRVVIFSSASLLLSACVSNVIPTLREPARLYDHKDEIDAIKNETGVTSPNISSIGTAQERNNIVTLRMYAIDQNYTVYESQLTHETQESGLGESLINLVLTGTASVAPTAEVGKALSAAATGITGASAAYDQKILLSQSVQNLETQMRADRNAQAAVILESLRCPLENYNVGMALSDLEIYYRAGTLPNALIALSKTVANAEDVAKATKASASPAKPVSEAGTKSLNKVNTIDTQSVVASTTAHCNGPAVFAATLPTPKVIPAHIPLICGLRPPVFADADNCQAIKSEIEDLKTATSKADTDNICREIFSHTAIKGGGAECKIY